MGKLETVILIICYRKANNINYCEIGKNMKSPLLYLANPHCMVLYVIHERQITHFDIAFLLVSFETACRILMWFLYFELIKYFKNKDSMAAILDFKMAVQYINLKAVPLN